jgi:hypothetical protein
MREFACAASSFGKASKQMESAWPSCGLGDFHKGERQRTEATKAVARGKMTFAGALQTHRERLKGDHSLKQRSKDHREERITALLKSWPELKHLSAAQILKNDCLAWAAEFGQAARPTAFNNTIGTLKMVLAVAVESRSTI